MDINAIASQTYASEGIKRHPYGEFSGVVSDVTVKKTGQGKRYFEIKIKTEHGEVVHNIFDFDGEDIKKLYADPTYKQKVQNKIAFVKRIFVDLSVVNPDSASQMGWSEGSPNVIGMLPLLKGRPCHVSVQQSDTGGYPRVYINAPMVASSHKSVDSFMGEAPRHSQSQSFAQTAPQQSRDPIPHQSGGQPSWGAGNLDDVPF